MTYAHWDLHPAYVEPRDVRGEPEEARDLRLGMEPLADWFREYMRDILVRALVRYTGPVNEQLYADVTADHTEWCLNAAYYAFEAGKKSKTLFPAHCDWGLAALYPAIRGDGLLVAPSGTFEPLVLPKGAMFLYAGDVLSRVTGGEIRALTHSVVQPTDEAGGRMSLIFYADPPRDMVLPDGLVVGDIIDSKLRKIGQIPQIQKDA